MKSNVLNNSLGLPYALSYPQLLTEEKKEILTGIFEQLLIFDKITLTTGRSNFALSFLIQEMGINDVERLLEMGYIEFILWSPLLFTNKGHRREDGSIDESAIFGQPPVISGTYTDEDLNPERNIETALSRFPLHRDRKRIFTRKALQRYKIPEGMLIATDSADLVIDAYRNNNLESFGLPYDKEPEQLHIQERGKLLELGNNIIETAILVQYGLKSYENYEPYKIFKSNLDNIGKAYHINENTSNLFRIENVPNLKQLILTERLDFESILKIRHLSNAKYYRKWINSIGENSNAGEVSEEYINEVKGDNKFFGTTKGKLLKSLSLFGLNTLLGTIVAGPAGSVIGGAVGILETFCLDGILKGRNPSMFINDIKKEIAPEVMPKIGFDACR